MPYKFPCKEGPWDRQRPLRISLLVVVRSFTLEDNFDIPYRKTVAYPKLGTLVIYYPRDHDAATDIGWWKVFILGQQGTNRPKWVHPGTLGTIHGQVGVHGDGQHLAFQPRRSLDMVTMSCHSMGEDRAPSWYDKQHCGYCAACIQRMAAYPSFRQHLSQAVELLEEMECLTLVRP